MSQQQLQDDLSNSSQSSQSKQKSRKPRKCAPKKPKKIIINISDCQYPVVSRVAKCLGWKLQTQNDIMDWDLCWTDNVVQPQTLSKMEPHQKINHFPGMFNLSRKNLMGRYLMKMRKKFPQHYSFFPLTWMLPVEYHQLKAYFDSKQKGKARTFIVKPQALSQGKGIYLTRKIQDIDQNAHCVVQRYLHRPYLIQGLKFDLRVYVLLASVDPLRLFIYHEGLTRFATQKYQPPTRQNMQDVCMHLTNYAINKDNPKFVFNNSSSDMSKGHKRSLTWFFDYLQKNDPRGTNLKQKIEDLIIKTMISGLPAITNTYRSCQPENFAANMCFQLLGFDVMLTDNCEPVILQINHTPSFTTDTPLDNLIKTNYIKDSLTLMNISIKNKQQILKQRKEACQQRVITGKKIKLTNEQKQIHKKKANQFRQNYQFKHIGGFKKIYPIDNKQRMNQYQQFLQYSNQIYLINTGTKKSSSINKRTEKIQTAFGTCFTKKNNIVTHNPIKNINHKYVTTDYIKNISTRNKHQQKKNISTDTTLLQHQKIQFIHSENLISTKRLSNEQKQQAKSVNQQHLLQQLHQQSSQSSSKDMVNQKKSAQSSIKFFQPSDRQECLPLSHKNFKQRQQVSLNIAAKKSIQQKSAFDMITQKQQQQYSYIQIQKQKMMQNFSSPKNQKLKRHNLQSSPSHPNRLINNNKQQAKNNINSVQILFDSDTTSSMNTTKKTQKQILNQNTINKCQQPSTALFGLNQIINEGDRNKFKTPTCYRNVTNIQLGDPKKQKIYNRQRIPILLNTLLIGSSQSNFALSAHNLRKINSKQSK